MGWWNAVVPAGSKRLVYIHLRCVAMARGATTALNLVSRPALVISIHAMLTAIVVRDVVIMVLGMGIAATPRVSRSIVINLL